MRMEAKLQKGKFMVARSIEFKCMRIQFASEILGEPAASQPITSYFQLCRIRFIRVFYILIFIGLFIL